MDTSYRTIAVGLAGAILVGTIGASLASAAAHNPLAVTSEDAQSGRNLEAPPTWRARYDTGDAPERRHVVMRPGWHIHPGAAGIFWDPGRFAAGNYAISSTMFLFPAGSGDPPAQVDAPYGILFGGDSLDATDASYATFLVRNDGSFRVAEHRGAETRDIVGWSPHEAVATWSEGDQGTAKNDLVVDVADETVSFWINERQVASVAREVLPVEGVVGLRAGDGLSLHITDIVIGPNRR